MAGGSPSYIGRYRAQKVVGSGAFATVWLAEDEALAAPVAIKVLAENWAHDEEVRKRFLEEGRILWRADSDHIVRIHNVDELPDGRPYFVMDFADRGTLHERMRGRIESGGRYTVDEAIALSLAVADGLKVAHSLGVVHRDLKPANIMFQSIPAHHGDDRDEKLILTDFGMAKSVARARGTTIATGTPYYMAPEQTEGRADERSDIYSAGVVLYELLAGRVPYPYDSPDGCSRRRWRSRRRGSRRCATTCRRRSTRRCTGHSHRTPTSAGRAQRRGATRSPRPRRARRRSRCRASIRT